MYADAAAPATYSVMMRPSFASGPAMSSSAFTTLPLRPELLASVAALNYDAMTAIQAQTLVLDEADRMLDMGFQDDILQIIARTPASRQTLFSATYPDDIQAISRRVQREPVAIRVAGGADLPAVEQVFIRVDNDERAEVLYRVIAHYRPESCLVFCNTRQQCERLTKTLQDRDLHARALHGDLEQAVRDQVPARFAGRSLSLLIATDVAARGLDVKALPAVINYELSPDPDVHLHRIGRTARAGASGLAVSLFAESETQRLRAIEASQGSPATLVDAETLVEPPGFKHHPPMVTLAVNGGRRHKLRAGNLPGALTAHSDITGEQIGRITRFDNVTYVAVARRIARLALTVLSEGRIKGKSFKARLLR